MNRRNILRGVAQSNLSAPPAALIYHAVLCYTFAVSLSIIHETQIPFTFFQDFLKKVFGALSVSQSSTAGVKPLSHGLRRDSSPSRGALGRPSRFRGLALRSFWQCWRNVRPLRQKSLLERQRSDRKMNLMPRPPLLGEVASSVSDDDGEVLHQKAPPSLKGAMGALYHITMGSAYSALGASGAFASSAFAAGSA